MNPDADSTVNPTVNPFESGARKVIPAVLVYGRLEDKILMIHRNSGSTGGGSPRNKHKLDSVDFHEGKWNGLGGKCELDESPLDAAYREFKEESGWVIPVERFRSLGVLQFPNFKPHKKEDWIIFVFTVNLSPGNLLVSDLSDEGTLHWVPIQDLLSLNLWPGDHQFIPYILREEPFIGTFWYDKLEVSKYWIQSFSLTQNKTV